MVEKEKSKIINRLRNKYRLVIYNDSTLAEVWYLKLSRLNVFTVLGLIIILLISMVTLLIAFTPLREFIPGYPDGSLQRKIIQNSVRTDSLAFELKIRDNYISNLRRILEGNEPIENDSPRDTSKTKNRVVFSKSEHDSLLRIRVEEEEKYNLSASTKLDETNNISKMHFFAPINKAVLVTHFSLEEEHFGIDAVAPPNESILAILDGTVIIAEWTLNTGYIIQIQHDNNLISVYKHNSKILTKQGARVKAGEAIAIIGNSGELTTGPHLHFELWHNGNPLNPEDYILF